MVSRYIIFFQVRSRKALTYMINWFISEGDDVVQFDISKIVGMGLLILTGFTHSILGWKIWHRKRRFFHQGEKHQLKIFAIFRQPTMEEESKDNFLLDHCLSFKSLAFLIPIIPIFFVLSMYFAGMPLILVRVIILSATLVMLPLSVYIRKPHVRKILKREFIPRMQKQ